jgi:hypothetical protein
MIYAPGDEDTGLELERRENGLCCKVHTNFIGAFVLFPCLPENEDSEDHKDKTR